MIGPYAAARHARKVRRLLSRANRLRNAMRSATLTPARADEYIAEFGRIYQELQDAHGVTVAAIPWFDAHPNGFSTSGGPVPADEVPVLMASLETASLSRPA